MRQKILKLWISMLDEFDSIEQLTMKNADADGCACFCVTRSNRVHSKRCAENDMKPEGLSLSHPTAIA
jgi:hypothetical protein